MCRGGGHLRWQLLDLEGRRPHADKQPDVEVDGERQQGLDVAAVSCSGCRKAVEDKTKGLRRVLVGTGAQTVLDTYSFMAVLRFERDTAVVSIAGETTVNSCTDRIRPSLTIFQDSLWWQGQRGQYM